MRAVCNALAAYLLWVAATYMLEGLPRTLMRPDAVELRLAYALVANFAIGMLLPLWLVRRQVGVAERPTETFGFSGARRTAVSAAAGTIAGWLLFQISRSEPLHPHVLVNSFAQVWVVSISEVLVCWALAGSAVFVALRAWNRTGAYIVAAATASVLFGLYHFAHSPPFNELPMVVFLSAVGVATSVWWFLSRDVWGTALFHNFFALTGVATTLEAQALVPQMPQLSLPLIATAMLSTFALLIFSTLWIRR